jgi:hypothetical protein
MKARKQYGKVQWAVAVLDNHGNWNLLSTRYDRAKQAIEAAEAIEAMDHTAKIVLM